MINTDEITIELHPSTIQEKVRRLAGELDNMYTRTPHEPVITGIVVMNAGLWFAADLSMAMMTPIDIHAYDPRHPRRLPDVRGRNVLLIDTICETGDTLALLRRSVLKRKAINVTTVVLIDREHHYVAYHYSGAIVDHHAFYVGYGLDTEGLYRNLPYIGVLNQRRWDPSGYTRGQL